jgi:hypothetical protein
MAEVLSEIIREQFIELNYFYPELNLDLHSNGSWIVNGILKINATDEGINFRDEFLIEMIIPEGYPDEPPVVKEIGNRILPGKNHKNLDGTLCLSTSLKICKIFSGAPTLLNFVKQLVVPFFFGFIHSEKLGSMPFGEFSHGGQGLLEDYLDYFEVDSNCAVLNLLICLADGQYNLDSRCPCGSDRKLRKCHAKKLNEAKKLMTWKNFARDYIRIYESIIRTDPNAPEMHMHYKIKYDALFKKISNIIDEMKAIMLEKHKMELKNCEH